MSTAKRQNKPLTDDDPSPGPQPINRTFKVRFGLLAQLIDSHPSPELSGKGEIEFCGNTIRLRGDLRTSSAVLHRGELAIDRDQVVDAERSGLTVCFRVTGLTEVDLSAEDERSAQMILQLLPHTKTAHAQRLAQQDREIADEKEFKGQLLSVGGDIWVTLGLVAINAAVFVVAVMMGAGFFSPDVSVLTRLGTNGPLTVQGQWWRLVSSMFLHVGFLHLFFNMLALVVGGRIVECLYGHAAFLLIYIVAGLCGSLCSLLWHPGIESAGASGAIFGVFGAELAYFLGTDNLVPATVTLSLRRSTIAFIAYNLLNGLIHPGIDNAAHIGGVVAGFALGLVLQRPLSKDARVTSDSTFYIPGLLTAAVIVGGLFFIVVLTLPARFLLH